MNQLQDRPDSDKSKEELLAELAAVRTEAAQLQQAFRFVLANGMMTQRQQVQDRLQDQLQDQLQVTQARLEHLLSASSAVIYSCQAFGDYAATFISDNVTEILGYDSCEFLQTPNFWANGIHPDDAERVFTQLAHLFETGTYAHEYRFRHQNGTYRWVKDECKLVTDAAGQPLEIVGYWVDISDRKLAETEINALNAQLEQGILERTAQLQTVNQELRHEIAQRQQAEAALRDRERRYQAIFNQTFQFIGLLTPEGILLEANQTALDFAGLTYADVIGRPVWETPWWQPDAEARHRLQEAVKAAAAGEFVRYEVDLIGADDAIATVDFSLKPVWDDDGKVVLIIPEGRDISDRKLAEVALRQAHDELEMRVQARTMELAAANAVLQAEIDQRQQQQALVTAQNQVLEAIATGKTLVEVLTILARAMEQQSPNAMCSILLASPDGTVLGNGVAPSLPASYNAAINKNGVRIAPISGSCGTAAYRRETVVVSDIDTDPLWAANRDLALAHKLRACWSEPIVSSTGKVLGTFAMYCRTPYHPNDRELDLIEKSTYLARIAIERDWAEQALQQSERRYTSLVQAAPVGIFRTDLQGNCVYVNDRWCEIAGLTRAEAWGTGWVIGIHPQDRERLFTEWYQAAQQQQPFRSEYRFQRPDGSIAWVFGQAVAEKGNNGEILSYVGTITDITKRKLAEAELQQAKAELEIRVAERTAQLSAANAQLQESEARMKALLDNAQSVIYMKDCEGRYLLINRSYEQLFHIQAQTHLGKTDFDIFPREIAENFRANDRAVLANNAPVEVEEVAWQDDEPHTYISTKFPVYDDSGVAFAVCGISTDITGRKRAEEALRDSEAKFRQLAENLDDIVWISDVNHQVLYVSPVYENIWGRKCEDLYRDSRQWLQAIYPEDRPRVEQAVREKMLQGCYDEEYRIIRPDGQIRWIRDRGFPVRNDVGEVYRIAGIAEDISDRKLAEAFLYQRQQEFVALIENSPDVIARFDRQLRYSYINSAIEKELGIPPQAFIGKTVREMGFPAEFVHSFEVALEQVLATGQEQIIELSAQTPNGRTFSQTRLIPENAPDGTVNSILALGRDITAIRAVEIAQRQQMEREQLLNAIAQHMRESLNLEEILNTTVTELQAFFQADRVLVYQIESNGSGKVVAQAVAPGWKSLLDLVLSIEAFPLHTQQQYLHGRIGTICDRDSGTILPCLADFMHQTQARAKLTIPIIQQHKLWGLLIVHQCSQPREWQAWESNLLQQLANKMAIAIQQSELHQQLQIELQERRQIEQALRQSETEFRLLSENSPLGIFRTNNRGEYIYINPRYQLICDCTFEEAMGKGWLQLIHPENRDFVISQNSKAVCEMKPCLSEFHFVRKDGSSRYCRVQATPLFNDNGTYMGHVGTLEDITESRAIAQMKNDFIGIVSHELRTPLTSLRGSLGLLATGVYDKKPEKGKRMLQVAADSAARLVRLVSDILDLERLESGKITLEQQHCNAADLMLQSVEAMRASAEQNQVTLSVTPLQMQIWAAPDAIIQTLTNLLSNAVKFSAPGSTVWLSAEIRESGVGSRESGKRAGGAEGAEGAEEAEGAEGAEGENYRLSTPDILFQVKDRGRGIPSDKLETIFGQFQQIDVSDSREKGGTGLGLAICRSIIRQHGGQIWAESTFGEGSSFYFTLPLNTVSSEQ